MAEIQTNATLAANAAYHSPSLDTASQPRNVHVLVHADQAGNLGIEESDDDATWQETVAAQPVAAAATFDGNPVATLFNLATQGLKYVRVVYVNGAVAQANFSLEANLV